MVVSLSINKFAGTMEKKQYTTPVTSVMKAELNKFFATLSANDNIGYSGGDDNNGYGLGKEADSDWDAWHE